LGEALDVLLFLIAIAPQQQESTQAPQLLQRASSINGGSSTSTLTIARVLHTVLASHGLHAWHKFQSITGLSILVLISLILVSMFDYQRFLS
jgi:hypothetical protein